MEGYYAGGRALFFLKASIGWIPIMDAEVIVNFSFPIPSLNGSFHAD